MGLSLIWFLMHLYPPAAAWEDYEVRWLCCFFFCKAFCLFYFYPWSSVVRLLFHMRGPWCFIGEFYSNTTWVRFLVFAVFYNTFWNAFVQCVFIVWLLLWLWVVGLRCFIAIVAEVWDFVVVGSAMNDVAVGGRIRPFLMPWNFKIFSRASLIQGLKCYCFLSGILKCYEAQLVSYLLVTWRSLLFCEFIRLISWALVICSSVKKCSALRCPAFYV